MSSGRRPPWPPPRRSRNERSGRSEAPGRSPARRASERFWTRARRRAMVPSAGIASITATRWKAREAARAFALSAARAPAIPLHHAAPRNRETIGGLSVKTSESRSEQQRGDDPEAGSRRRPRGDTARRGLRRDRPSYPLLPASTPPSAASSPASTQVEGGLLTMRLACNGVTIGGQHFEVSRTNVRSVE
jgi:hypothetical protein